MGYDAILDAIRALSVDDQRRLLAHIESELANHGDDTELSSAQLREINRRIKAHDANPGDVIPWSRVEKSIERHLKELGE